MKLATFARAVALLFVGLLACGRPGSGPSSTPSGPLAPVSSSLVFGSSRLLSDDSIRGVATDDGRVATLAYGGAIDIWDLASGKRTHRLQTKRIDAMFLRGRYLFALERTGRGDHLVRIAWETGAEEARVPLEPGASEDAMLAVDEAGKRVAVSRGLGVEVRDATGAMASQWSRTFTSTSMFSRHVHSLAFSVRGLLVATTEETHVVDQAGADTMKIEGDSSAVMTPHGIAHATEHGLVLVDQKTKRTTKLPAPSGTLVLAGDGALWVHDHEGQLHRIDVANRRVLGTFPSHGVTLPMAPTKDGVVAVTLHRLAVFGARGWSPEHGANLYDMSLSPDGRTLATVDHMGRVIRWDARTGAALGSLDAHVEGEIGDAHSVTLLAEPYVLTIAKDTLRPGTALLHDTSTGRHVVMSKNIYHSSALTDGRHVVVPDQITANGVFMAAWHSYETGPTVRDLGRHDRSDLRHPCLVRDKHVVFTSLQPEGRAIVRSDGPRDEKLFDVERSQVRCSPDGRHFVIVPSDEQVPARVVDARGQLVGELALEMRTTVPEIAFSADGHHLVMLGSDRTLQHWTLRDGRVQEQASMVVDADPENAQRVRSIALSPDGTHVYQLRTHDVVVHRLP